MSNNSSSSSSGSNNNSSGSNNSSKNSNKDTSSSKPSCNSESEELFDNIKSYKESKEYRDSVSNKKQSNELTEKTYPQPSPKEPVEDIGIVIEIVKDKNAPIVTNYIIDEEKINEYIKENRSNLSSEQKVALKKINDYSNNPIIKENYIDKTTSDPLIFFFEGAKDKKEGYEWEPVLTHKKGRYQAMAVVIKNNEIVGVFTDASTLPTDPYSINPNSKTGEPVKTIADGVYEFNSGLHHSIYAALRIRNGGTVPAYVGKEHIETTEHFINIHYNYNSDNTNNPGSTGCLTININSEYNDFANAVGFKPENREIKPHNKPMIDYIPLEGYVVIDRSLRPNW